MGHHFFTNCSIKKRPLFFIISLILISIIKEPLQARNLSPHNVGPTINTKFDEFSPTLTSDAKTLVFNSKRKVKGYMDIYKSEFKNKKWSKPKPITEINSRYNDETPFLSPDGSFIIFASDRDGSKEMPKDKAGRIRVSFDLYIAYKTPAGTFGLPRALPGNVNSIHHEKSPAISEDGNTLYFTRYPFGDISKSEIYSAKITDKGFINPKPLPKVINSGHQEVNLTVAYGKQGFYFSSKRPGGFGSWDIWFISYKNNVFGEPKNMGSEINTAASENYLYETSGIQWFCSNRKGGMGRFDIYGMPALPPEQKLVFKVIDKETRKPLKTTAILTATLGKKSGNIKKETNEKGIFEVNVHPKITRLETGVNESGYLPWFSHVDLKNSDTKKPILIELEKMKTKGSFHTQSINFDFNSARIKKDSRAYLESLARFLQEHKTMRIEIIGHTDDVGSNEFNQKLSLERANSVKSWLVQNGIDAFRLQTTGAGKSRPLQKGTSEQDRAANRRTEFKIL